jgi:chromosome segregation protein
LRLKKLEIRGFKSFPDRTEMSFEGGITGIVGPNGCGKSNISDAVRWVLGEQSAKSLRGGKMQDVIFGGTEKRRRLSCCEVTLTLENEDRALPIDFAEVAICRRVYRDGNGEYAINGAPCRLRDVVDLLRDTGIGREGYSLIGQGRIDEILSGKSEDRRRVFEEAAGIVKYKARKTEAERRIQNTRQNLERVEDILRELSGRLEPLAQQSEVAREYLALREELRALELNAFLVRSDRLSQRTEELTRTHEGLAAALEEAGEARAKLTAGREQAQQSLAALEADSAAARERVQALIGDVEAREGAAGVLKERIASDERDMARLSAQADAARQGDEGVSARLDEMAARIDEEARALEQAAAEKSGDERALTARETADAQAEERIERLKAELIEAMNRLSDVRSEAARLTAMRSALLSQVEKLRDGHKIDRSAGDELEKAEVEAALRLEGERAAKAQLDNETARIAQRVRESSERYDEISARLAQRSSERQQAASRLSVLEEMQRDFEGYQHSVKNVLMQARRNAGSGVCGVVATLIRVPEQLERALDMALGGALQNIVVEREEDAKRMIDYLRANRLGRATFLPLSAVRGRTLSAAERRVLSMPGCLGVASELIQFDPAYRGVVENLLGRTVVARNLDAGIEIMRSGGHAFRLVTLDGDVMNPGGSMTGGSVQSRMTSLLTRQREVDSHRARIAQLGEEIESLGASAEQLEAERAGLKRERAELFEKLHQQEIAVAREEAHLTAAKGDVAAHKKRAQAAEDERGRIKAQLSDVEAALARIDGREGGEEQAGSEKRAEIAALQKALQTDRAATAALRQQVLDRSVGFASQSRGLDALRADHERLARERGDLKQLLLQSQTQQAACSARIEAGRKSLQDAQAELGDARKALDAQRADFDRCDRARTEAQRSLERLMAETDRLRAEADELSDKCHRAELQRARVEAEWKQLSDRIWEDYELTYEGASAARQEGFRLNEAEKRIAEIRARVREMGAVNVSAVDEYREIKDRHDTLTTQRDDLVKAEADLDGIISDLVSRMERQFTQQFTLLNQYFQKTFVKLFGGGNAQLRLEDPKDALGCEIEVVAQPPGKKLTLLSLLSGGERALTAIAILFAMLELKPTPFCFLDEIEAALDDANIDNFADYLRDYSQNTQFVVVTHRKGTMERCDALYGVSMEEKGVSRMVSLRLDNH